MQPRKKLQKFNFTENESSHSVFFLRRGIFFSRGWAVQSKSSGEWPLESPVPSRSPQLVTVKKGLHPIITRTLGPGG